MGTPLAAVPSLERLAAEGHQIVAVYTQPDRPSGRGRKLTASPVKQCATALGFPIFQPEKIKASETIAEFEAHGADVAVVAAYGRILPLEYLNAYPLGAINVHYSLLPKYRGAAPVNWAIVNGERETGVTTMRMDEGLDTGDILLQRATAINADEDAVSLMSRLSNIGAGLIVETLANIDSIVPSPQDNSAATFAPLLSKKDGAINWELDAATIVDRIRGFQPFPSSYSQFRNARITFWRAKALEESDPQSVLIPGSIIAADDGGFKIKCGDHSVIVVEEIQPEGRKRMSARDFVNGLRPIVGECFGDGGK